MMIKRRGFIGGFLAMLGLGGAAKSAESAGLPYDPLYDPQIDARRVFLDGMPDAEPAVIDGLMEGECYRTYKTGPRGEIRVYESRDGFAWAYRGDIPAHRLTYGSEFVQSKGVIS